MIYYTYILKYIYVSSIDSMFFGFFLLNWVPQTLSEFRVLNKKKWGMQQFQFFYKIILPFDFDVEPLKW